MSLAHERQAKLQTQRRSRDTGCCRRCFRDANVLVGPSVIEEESIAVAHHALDEDNIRHLANLLPVELRSEDRLLAPVKNFPWVLSVEDHNAGAINELVVGPVINEQDAIVCQDGGGP